MVMFDQLLRPSRTALGCPSRWRALPIVTVLVVLGGLRRPAWQASLAGLIVGLVIAVGFWRCRPASRPPQRCTAWCSRFGR